MKTLLRGATVVTVNPRKEILEDRDLLIEDDRIAWIGSPEPPGVGGADRVVECKGKIIIPGLVSAHSHLTGLFQRGLWDETSFEAWASRSSLTESLLKLSAQDIYTIHTAACAEFLRHGVTTVLNMYVSRPDLSLDRVGAATRAFSGTGIRGILALSVMDQSPDNRVIGPESALPDGWVGFARGAAEQVARADPRITFMLAPSAPQRCSDRLLIRCRELAHELGVPVHTHLSEAKAHAEVGRQLYGESIVRHLAKIGFLTSRLSVAHAIWLDDEEIDLLKRHDVKVVHNPSSNMKLGSGVARVKKMLREGLAVGLGADSVNAGTLYSVFEQLRLAVLLPRVRWGPEEWVAPGEAFEMGTLGGARALLQNATIGSIEQGKKADLVILKPSTSLLPLNDVVHQLVLSETGHSVESVFVDGRPVMLEGRFETFDEEAILAALSALRPRILKAREAILERLKGS